MHSHVILLSRDAILLFTITVKHLCLMLKTAKMMKDLGRKSQIVQGDIRSASVAENLFIQGVEAFGKVDIVINNVGAVLKK
ncbi:hypothetical protein N482_14875 [Pseudoalteromonas luteoviolacea NCIMB 1942]|uniref:Short-chain dehydrogenase n=1 Tax=Pseudoalteromonas luteoviolacea NCIMB 1942 TaxID=1365253 RepID=A0A167AL20_9GAMM|nr:hypothetical protein N482_14875 [Pseudoalteromonas luteoviolacea NCIMB 1942]